MHCFIDELKPIHMLPWNTYKPQFHYYLSIAYHNQINQDFLIIINLVSDSSSRRRLQR